MVVLGEDSRLAIVAALHDMQLNTVEVDVGAARHVIILPDKSSLALVSSRTLLPSLTPDDPDHPARASRYPNSSFILCSSSLNACWASAAPSK
jgi:hypothetical protein